MSLDPLDQLLIELELEQTAKRKRHTSPYSRAGNSFTNPEEWTLMQQVQLIHRSDDGKVETLIGVFDDLRHRTGARKLTAAHLTTTPSIEYVTGQSWLPQRLLERPKAGENTIVLLAQLSLDCGCSSREPVLVTAHFRSGGVDRLVLDEATVFESFTPRTILALPAGLDVFEGLTQDCKRAIWLELTTQEKGLTDE